VLLRSHHSAFFILRLQSLIFFVLGQYHARMLAYCLPQGTQRMNLRRLPYASIIALCLLCAGGCPSKPSPDSNSPGRRKTTADEIGDTSHEARATSHGYKLIRTYPHDPQAFTQGLVYEDGILYEGTGINGQSSLTKRNLQTNELLKRERLPYRYFGEGITIFGDQVIQLTWRSQKGFVYDKATFRLLREFSYPGEGWGITHDGKQLIMSDGTATLRFLDPNTFAEARRVTVRDDAGPVDNLNELEFIEAKVFANVWMTDFIVVIDPNTGRVTTRLDFSALYPRPADTQDVLNGIAWLPESRHLLLTGKCWPRLYEVELNAEPPANR
jgi:glutamine cyclotransferase